VRLNLRTLPHRRLAAVAFWQQRLRNREHHGTQRSSPGLRPSRSPARRVPGQCRSPQLHQPLTRSVRPCPDIADRWRRHAELLPFWSANGITPMFASVLGMALSIEFGIARTSALGVGFCAGLCLDGRGKPADKPAQVELVAMPPRPMRRPSKDNLRCWQTPSRRRLFAYWAAQRIVHTQLTRVVPIGLSLTSSIERRAGEYLCPIKRPMFPTA
jgi:hypothetical protein